MNVFLKKIVLFGFLLIMMDQGLFLLLQSQRPIDYKLFLEAKSVFFEEEQHFDLLILGDSHVTDALDPRTIETSLALNCYNLGVYHASPYEVFHMAKAALEHLSIVPDMVVLGTNPEMFSRPLSQGVYTPLILKNNLSLIFDSEEGVGQGYFLKTYRERHLFKHILQKLQGKTYKPSRNIVSVYNGHLQFYDHLDSLNWDIHGADTAPASVNAEQVDYFLATISLLQARGIRVIIVNPPLWAESENQLDSTSENQFHAILKQIVEDTVIELFPTQEKSCCGRLTKFDFRDLTHLNYEGSMKFTQEFCYFLKESTNPISPSSLRDTIKH